MAFERAEVCRIFDFLDNTGKVSFLQKRSKDEKVTTQLAPSFQYP
jgi:hypothetical protein